MTTAPVLTSLPEEQHSYAIVIKLLLHHIKEESLAGRVEQESVNQSKFVDMTQKGKAGRKLVIEAQSPNPKLSTFQ